MKFEIITDALLAKYEKKQTYTLHKHMAKIYASRHQQKGLKFILSSVYSSLIEGSRIDLDTYQFNKQTGYQSKEMKQIDDLVAAYEFAQSHVLNEGNFLKIHFTLSKNFAMHKQYKGAYRNNVNVKVGNAHITVYEGCQYNKVALEMQKLWNDIATLKARKLTYNQAFYYASAIHLVFVKIHPFADGNGRAARLLEKWFLATMLGNQSWYVPSEAYYNHKRENYYANLQIGKTYDTVDYSDALPFALMLPQCFGMSKNIYEK